MDAPYVCKGQQTIIFWTAAGPIAASSWPRAGYCDALGKRPRSIVQSDDDDSSTDEKINNILNLYQFWTFNYIPMATQL